MRHQRLLFSLTQTLFDRFFNSSQTGTVLVFGQFAHASNTTISQVVDIINLASAIAQINQYFDNRQDVFIGQNHWAC